MGHKEAKPELLEPEKLTKGDKLQKIENTADHCSPAVCLLSTSSWRTLQTHCSPLSHYQGFHNCESNQMHAKATDDTLCRLRFLVMWEEVWTHRSKSLVMMRSAHFLHFHHTSSGRSSSSTSNVSWQTQTHAHKDFLLRFLTLVDIIQLLWTLLLRLSVLRIPLSSSLQNQSKKHSLDTF